MTSRSRGYSSQPDWDPMQEDFDNVNYEPQYQEDNLSDVVKLDHCRLYVTNIPKGLNEDGFRSALSKYGTLTEVFLSKDPAKRYGIAAYETAAEARHAMMKLNKTEPLKLNIAIAHEKGTGKKRPNQNRSSNRNAKERESGSWQRERNNRDDTASYGSRSRNRTTEEMANGDNMVAAELPVDIDNVDLGLDNLDADLQLELERLQLEHLRVKQAQVACKKRIALKEAERRAHASATPSSRCVMPDGKIVVRSTAEGSMDHRDGDSSYAAAGDSLAQLTIPALQREGSRTCVSCGKAAGAFCGRCGVTPYCSTRCQRRDWLERHKAVCHNLARSDTFDDNDEFTLEPAVPAPLRRPRSPVQATNDRDSGSDKGFKKFAPPGYHAKPVARTPRGGGAPNRPLRQPDRNGTARPADKDDDDWGNAAPKPSEEEKPASAPRRPPFMKPANQAAKEVNNSAATNQRASSSNPTNERKAPTNQSYQRTPTSSPVINEKPFIPAANQRQMPSSPAANQAVAKEKPPGNMADVTPTKKIIPKRVFCGMLENLPEGQALEVAIHSKRARVLPPVVAKNPKSETLWSSLEMIVDRVDEATPSTSHAQETASPMPPASLSPQTVMVSSTAQYVECGASSGASTPKTTRPVCVIETLSVGESVLLSVDNSASECRAPSGFVCLSLHEKYSDDYTALCGEYGTACEAEQPITPTPGEAFSYLNKEDGGWYRARCVSATEAALIDASKVVALSDGQCVPLPLHYHSVPEFCCLLQADANVGDNLTAQLVEKIPNGFKVSLSSTEGVSLGGGTLTRWLPTVTPAVVAKVGAKVEAKVEPQPAGGAQKVAASATPTIPEVSRPPLQNNSVVILVHVENIDAMFVRRADKTALEAYDAALHDTVIYGLSATPLSEPPSPGQYVVSKFTDGIHYRALVRRTSVKLNKYLLEYVEFGNSHINQLENLYPLPEHLSLEKMPTQTSQVRLAMETRHPLTDDATRYLDALKDDNVELVLDIPSDEAVAPSGSDVKLTVEQNNESVNRKVEELCTPEWIKLQAQGVDVTEMEPVMYDSLKYVDLPSSGELTVLEHSALHAGLLSACPKDHPHINHVFTTLSHQMGLYCESKIGKEPYLPKPEELCIVQVEPGVYRRAVLAEQPAGAGGAAAHVLYVDVGNVAQVHTLALRKLLPAFLATPALANSICVRGFPPQPTAEQLQRAIKYLQINKDGRGVIKVTKCEYDGSGMYNVDAPDFLAAVYGR